MMKRALLLLIVSFSTVISLAQTPSLDLLTAYMTGEFSSKSQAKSDTHFLDISLKMTRIWEDQPDAVWLYVEQAASNNLKNPYRQRVYKLVEFEAGKYASYVFQIPNSEQYIGANKKPKLLESLTIEDLVMLEGCQIGLHFAKAAFRGSTEGKCPSNWSGASIATSEVEIYNGKLISWDRGWTEEGKQVWGSTKGGYVFLKK